MWFPEFHYSLLAHCTLHKTLKTNSAKNILCFLEWDGEGFHCYLEPQIINSGPQYGCNMLSLAFLSLSNIVTLLKSLYVLFKSQLECAGHTNAPIISFRKSRKWRTRSRSQRGVKTHQCLESFFTASSTFEDCADWPTVMEWPYI